MKRLLLVLALMALAWPAGATCLKKGSSCLIPDDQLDFGIGTFRICGEADTIASNTVYYGPSIVLWDDGTDRKSTRLNSSHSQQSRMPSSA